MSDHFLTEDKAAAVAFGEFIFKHAKWNFDTKESFELNKHFQWYTALTKKIEAHIFELLRATKPSPESQAAVAEDNKKGKGK